MRLRVLLGVIFFFLFSINSYSVYGAYDLLDTWNFTTPLADTRVNSQSHIYDNRLYIFGGAANKGVTRSYVYSSLINSDGTLNTWISESPMLRELIWHSSIMVNNKIYIIGGVEETDLLTNSTNAISVASINPEGNISSWEDLPSQNFLPEKLGNGSLVRLGKFIYFLGGGIWNDRWPPTVSNRIYYAEISADDNIGTWQVSDNLLPTPLIAQSTFTHNNRIYILGGSSNNTFNSTNKIYVYEAASDDGKLTRLPDEDDLPFSIRSTMLQKVGNYIIVAGGVSNGNAVDIVRFARIDSEGKIGSWVTSIYALPLINCCTTISSDNKYIYILGGHDAKGPYYNNVFFSKLDENFLNDILPTSTPTEEPTPTNTPFPTITPTPTIPPTPTLKPPVVIIPGIGASWNYEGIIHNKTDTVDTDWKIPSYIKIYDGLISAFKNSGYILGKNLFVYAYDWRRNIPETSLRLNHFINTTVQKNEYEESKVDLVSHSMGGLVVANYIKNFGAEDVGKAITLGTPYSGSAKSYKVWEGLDFSGYKGYEVVLIKTLLGVNAAGKTSMVESLHQYSPSIQSLLPTYDFLNLNSSDIPLTNLKWQNNFTDTLTWNGLPFWITSIGGSGSDTLYKLIVKKPDTFDKMFGRWVDGEPIGNLYTNGDGTVTSFSSHPVIATNKTVWENTNHADLVASVANQERILELVGTSGQGVPVNQPDFDQSLIITMASPAKFSLITPRNKELIPEDNFLIVNQPEKGLYKVRIISTGSGSFTLHVGKMNKKQMLWNHYSGNFSKAGQIQTKTFTLDLTKPNLGDSRYYYSRFELGNLRKLISSSSLSKYKKLLLTTHLDFLEKLLDRCEKSTHASSYKLVMETILPSLERFYSDTRRIVDPKNKLIIEKTNNSISLIRSEIETDYFERF